MTSPGRRVEGVRGNREVSPAARRGFVGETWFPPRERAGTARDVDQAMRIVEGTARSMGVEVAA
jgi:Ribosomal protein L11, RNA binding domain